MSMIRTLGANPGAVATAGTRVPCWSGPSANLLTASTFSIVNGQAIVVVANTFNSGDQVTMYGFSTATYFNGVTVQVQSANAAQFTFPTTHSNVGSTSDAGKVFPNPPERFRAIRIEIDQSASTNKPLHRRSECFLDPVFGLSYLDRADCLRRFRRGHRRLAHLRRYRYQWDEVPNLRLGVDQKLEEYRRRAKRNGLYVFGLRCARL